MCRLRISEYPSRNKWHAAEPLEFTRRGRCYDVVSRWKGMRPWSMCNSLFGVTNEI